VSRFWQGLSGYFTIGNVALIVNRDGSNRERLNVISDSDGILLANHVELLRFFRIIINPYIVSGDFEQLTDMDVAAGVRVAWFNWHTYMDITVDLNNSLDLTVREAERRRGFGGDSDFWELFYENSPIPESSWGHGNVMPSIGARDLIWFKEQVEDKGPWDIKTQDGWESNTMQSAYPGRYNFVVYERQLITLGDLGNYTYAYIGAALGLPPEMLVGGSIFVAAKNYIQGTGEGGFFNQARNEFFDWPSIQKGYIAYLQRARS